MLGLLLSSGTRGLSRGNKFSPLLLLRLVPPSPLSPPPPPPPPSPPPQRWPSIFYRQFFFALCSVSPRLSIVLHTAFKRYFHAPPERFGERVSILDSFSTNTLMPFFRPSLVGYTSTFSSSPPLSFSFSLSLSFSFPLRVRGTRISDSRRALDFHANCHRAFPAARFEGTRGLNRDGDYRYPRQIERQLSAGTNGADTRSPLSITRDRVALNIGTGRK